jgi:hypothetical protein
MEVPWWLRNPLECRDAADEGNTVAAQGMDGFLGVIRSAMATDNPSAPDVQGAGEPAAATCLRGGGAQSAEGGEKARSDALDRRAEAQLQRKLAQMDKYELKRFEAERALRRGAAAAAAGEGAAHTAGHDAAHTAGRAAVAGRPESDAGVPVEGAEPAAGGGEGVSRGAQPGAAAGARKRTAEEKIAAARARAKERKITR